MSRVGYLLAGRHLIDERTIIIHSDGLDYITLAIVNVGCQLECAERLDFPNP